MKFLAPIFAAVGLMAAVACEPYEAKKSELGDLPTASFTVIMVDSNTVQLTSTDTGDPFMYNWEVSNGTLAEGGRSNDHDFARRNLHSQALCL